MGCNVIVGGSDEGECAVFYDSVTEVAFGPLMNDLEEAESFQKWLKKDARTIPVKELIKLLNQFREERE